MFCRKCGTQLSNDAQFCSGCGNSVNPVIYCRKCGNQMSMGTGFCAKCGTPTGSASPPPPPQINAPQHNITYSLHNIACSNCGAKDCFKLLSTAGANARGWGTYMAVGWVGDMALSQTNTVTNKAEPLRFKCQSCKFKFEAMPLQAQPDELLTEPCKIILKRKHSIFDMTMIMSVYLNGVKVGTIDNGNTLELTTNIKNNNIFITSHHGEGRDFYKFEASSGGCVNAIFNGSYFE